MSSQSNTSLSLPGINKSVSSSAGRTELVTRHRLHETHKQILLPVSWGSPLNIPNGWFISWRWSFGIQSWLAHTSLLWTDRDILSDVRLERNHDCAFWRKACWYYVSIMYLLFQWYFTGKGNIINPDFTFEIPVFIIYTFQKRWKKWIYNLLSACMPVTFCSVCSVHFVIYSFWGMKCTCVFEYNDFAVIRIHNWWT